MSKFVFDCRPIKAEMLAVIDNEHFDVEARILVLAKQVPGLTASRFAEHVGKLVRSEHTRDRARKLVNVLNDQVPKTWVVRTVVLSMFVGKWSLILSAIGLVVWLVTR